MDSKPISVRLSLRTIETEVVLPAETVVFPIRRPPALSSVPAALATALNAPMDSPPLSELARRVLDRNESGSAVVVISDNTRPVPYTGPDGIQWPIVESLLQAGFHPERISILVATGTHRVMTDPEMSSLVDDRVTAAGVGVISHDAHDPSVLVAVGSCAEGTTILMNREYVTADLKILTGLVESHFMAGVSGGRKSICPGLLGVQSLKEFHGAAMMEHPGTRDMNLADNLCHEYAVQVARIVPPDFVVNVTIRDDGRPVGVFAGSMDRVLEAAFEQLKSLVLLPIPHRFDIVITHGGLGAINHYQASKAANTGAKAATRGGFLVVLADTTDPDPIGNKTYKEMLKLMKKMGPKAFRRLIASSDWTWVPDQWVAQMWAKILDRVPEDHLFYYSPQTRVSDYALLPCAGPPPECAASDVPQQIAALIARARREATLALGRRPSIAYLPDGPYGIPIEAADDSASTISDGEG
jgi:nickel-dependent lactate racemase